MCEPRFKERASDVACTRQHPAAMQEPHARDPSAGSTIRSAIYGWSDKRGLAPMTSRMEAPPSSGDAPHEDPSHQAPLNWRFPETEVGPTVEHVEVEGAADPQRPVRVVDEDLSPGPVVARSQEPRMEATCNATLTIIGLAAV